jgi:hypothetical protein
MPGMQNVLRLVAAICVSTCALLWISGSASAGGPTSAIVVNPANEATGALYHSDTDYGILLEALSTPADDGDVAPDCMHERPAPFGRKCDAVRI